MKKGKFTEKEKPKTKEKEKEKPKKIPKPPLEEKPIETPVE